MECRKRLPPRAGGPFPPPHLARRAAAARQRAPRRHDAGRSAPGTSVLRAAVLRRIAAIPGPPPEGPFLRRWSRGESRGSPARPRAPAGLTGWAQTHALGGDTPMPGRARFDTYSSETWSLGLASRISLRTATAVLRRQGAWP